MTDETQAAIKELGELFSRCPKSPFGQGILGHLWNMDIRKCDYCGAPYPIERDES